MPLQRFVRSPRSIYPHAATLRRIISEITDGVFEKWKKKTKREARGVQRSHNREIFEQAAFINHDSRTFLWNRLSHSRSFASSTREKHSHTRMHIYVFLQLHSAHMSCICATQFANCTCNRKNHNVRGFSHRLPGRVQFRRERRNLFVSNYSRGSVGLRNSSPHRLTFQL